MWREIVTKLRPKKTDCEPPTKRKNMKKTKKETEEEKERTWKKVKENERTMKEHEEKLKQHEEKWNKWKMKEMKKIENMEKWKKKRKKKWRKNSKNKMKNTTKNENEKERKMTKNDVHSYAKSSTISKVYRCCCNFSSKSSKISKILFRNVSLSRRKSTTRFGCHRFSWEKWHFSLDVKQ